MDQENKEQKVEQLKMAKKMENHDKMDIFGKGFSFIGVISTGTDI